MLRLILSLPLAAGFAALLGEESEAGRRRRRKARHRHRTGSDKENRNGQRKGKDKGKKNCRPESTAQTCAGKCGTVTNNRGAQVDCGPCACTTNSCPDCETCDDGTGLCEADATQDEDCRGETDSGTWRQGGACVTPGSLADCQGRCDTDENGEPVIICGQEIACPDCDSCMSICSGSDGSCTASGGPAGQGRYCISASGLGNFCPCSADEACCGGTCEPICT